MEKAVQVNPETISGYIYYLRGEKVIVDSILAQLYGVEVKVLKRAVRRNIARFPSDFMFELTREEYNSLRCKIGTLEKGKHSKFLPFAFTEQGVAMLSGILPRKLQLTQVPVQSILNLQKLFMGSLFNNAAVV